MTRVLVTGGTGLIGSALVPGLCSAGHEVVTTSRGGERKTGHEPADLTDRRAVDRMLHLTRPDVVIHLAGGSSADRTTLLRGNVDTTSTLLQSLARVGIRLDRLVIAGSSAEYGEGNGQPLSEDAVPAPVTPYGLAKNAQRQVAQLMGPAIAERVVHVRPFNVVAPGLPPATPLGNLRRQVLAGRDTGSADVLCGRLDILRDFVPLEDVVSSLVALTSLPEPPPVLNICSGTPVLLGDLVDEVVRQSRVAVRLVQDPALVALPAAHQVVGDAGRLRSLGLHRPVTVRRLASFLLGDGTGAAVDDD